MATESEIENIKKTLLEAFKKCKYSDVDSLEYRLFDEGGAVHFLSIRKELLEEKIIIKHDIRRQPTVDKIDMEDE